MANKQTFTIKADSRQAGKSTSRSLRTSKMIPAIVYGPKMEKNLSFCIAENDAVKYSRHGFENAILTLESPEKGLNGLKVLRKQTDVHPLSRRPIHMDFFAPDMTKTVRVDIEIRLTGKAAGLADGGLVSQVRRDIEIECLPLEIPEFFELDVTNLGLDESFHVSDIQFPEGVKVLTAMGETLATCAIVEEASLTPTAAAEGAGSAADPTAAGGAPAAGAKPAAGGAAAPAAGAKPAAGAAGGAKPAGDKK